MTHAHDEYDFHFNRGSSYRNTSIEIGQSEMHMPVPAASVRQRLFVTNDNLHFVYVVSNLWAARFSMAWSVYRRLSLLLTDSY